MKKMISIALVILIVFSLFAACTNNTDNNNGKNNNDPSTNGNNNNDNGSDDDDGNKDDEISIDFSNILKTNLESMSNRNITNIDLLKEDFSLVGANNDASLLFGIFSGPVAKDTLFIHAPGSGYKKVNYILDLTGASNDSLIFLNFSTGFIMGAAPDGVKFTVFVNDEIVFEHSQKVVKYIDHLIDLSKYAGQEIKVTFATSPDPTSSYAWSVFGSPSLTVYENDIIKDIYETAGSPDTRIIVEGNYEFVDNKISTNEEIELSIKNINMPQGYVVITGRSSSLPQTSVYFNRLKSDSDLERRFKEFPISYPTEEGYFKYVVSVEMQDNYSLQGHLSFKIKPEDNVIIDDISYYIKDSYVNVLNYDDNKNTILSKREFEIRAEIQNLGAGNLSSLDDLSYIVKNTTTGESLTEIKVDRLLSNESMVLKFPVEGLDKGSYSFDIYEKQFGIETKVNTHEILVKSGYDIDDNSLTFIENDNLKIILYLENDLVSEAHIYSKKKDLYIGTLKFGKLVTDKYGEIELDDFNFDISENTITLTKDLDFANIQNTWTLDESGISMTHSLISNEDLDIYLYDGPILLGFDYSYGDQKDSAIFSGIDYLDDQPSNHTEAILPPFHDRWAPHPHKITIPVISLEKDDLVIAYSWNHTGQWSDGETLPSTYFQSPNFDMKDYHEIGIFAPSIPEYVDENTHIAKNPFVLTKGKSINLSSHIKVLEGENAVEGVYDYVKNMELPEYEQAKLTYTEMLEVFLRGLYREKRVPEGWVNFIGVDAGATYNIAAIQNLILMTSVLDDDSANLAQELIDMMEFPLGEFYWSFEDSVNFRLDPDVLEEYYLTVISRASNMISSQNADGTWGYSSSDPSNDIFGTQGEITMGTVVVPILHLVKAYKLTGNENFWKAAKKGFDALDNLTMPDGAGPWELPNANPDNLAAILSLIACMDAYEYTKDEEILDLAKDIAKMLLPFINLMDYTNDDNESLYTVIASYGATNWRATWQGRPVQWQGAMVVPYLKMLSKYDDSLDWNKIAVGIQNAAINMINTNNQPGRFPDFINLYSDEKTIYNIWPTLVVVDYQYDNNHPFQWQVSDTENNHIVSGANISNVSENSNELIIELSTFEDANYYTMILTENEYTEIYLDGVKLNIESALDLVESGWRKSDSFKGYIIKTKASTDLVSIKLK